MADIFISYKREDRRFAERLSIALEQLGFDVWWDFDLLSGDRFRNVIRAVIDQCPAAIVLWSEKAVTSDFVMDEATYAKSKGKLCPAHIDAVELPFGFGQIHTDDLSDWDGELSHSGFQALVRSIESRVGRKARLGSARKGADAQAASAELDAFKAAQLANNASALTSFVKAYPRGMFAGFVRGQLETMQVHAGASAGGHASPGPSYAAPQPPQGGGGFSAHGAQQQNGGGAGGAQKKPAPLPLILGAGALVIAAFFFFKREPDLPPQPAEIVTEDATHTGAATPEPFAVPDTGGEIRSLQEQLAAERAAREQMARDQAAQNQLMRDQTAREQAAAAQAAAAASAVYDVTQLNVSVRSAVESARAAESRGNSAGASARAAAQRATASGVVAPASGEGTQTYTGDHVGDLYAGQFSNSERSGFGVFNFALNPNNKSNGLRYEGEWATGKRNGYGIGYWRDGDRYSGAYRNDTKNGYGVYRSAGSGIRYEGDFANGNYNGYGVKWAANGRVMQAGIWTDNTLTTPLGPQGQ
jgi:hypothetical protein